MSKSCDSVSSDDSHVITIGKSSDDNIASSNFPSSLINSIDIGEITEQTDSALMSTSAVLLYCKSKILYPYLKFLAVMGLRPVSLNQINNSKFQLILSHYHTLQITIFIGAGYFLQYMSCFRRDRGFYQDCDDRSCYKTIPFAYIIPFLFHFTGYLYAIYLFRISDNEHLQNLMERVFLLSSFPPQGTFYDNPKKLLKVLWIIVILSVIWIICSFTIVALYVVYNCVTFEWIDEDDLTSITIGKVFLVICTLTHDIVQGTIIANYCLQTQLLTSQLQFLRNRLLTRTISALDWMREIGEFKKLLRHLNDVLAPSICLFTVVNVSWMCSGLLWIFNFDKIDTMNPISAIDIINLFLWTLIAMVPFICAARLSTACAMTQAIGHEIIARPFLHQETPQEDLNSVLLYASTLKLSARLFRFPIKGRHLCVVSTILCVGVLTLGMCHYIQA